MPLLHIYISGKKKNIFLTCTHALTNFAKSGYLASNSLICLKNNIVTLYITYKVNSSCMWYWSRAGGPNQDPS